MGTIKHATSQHCVIFAAMPVSDGLRRYWQEADVIIAADAGYRTARALGLSPTLMLGDYDGGAPAPKDTKNTIVLPAHKDDTDTYYAAKQALRMGARRVTILGGMGGRLDHTLANLQTLLFLEQHGVRALLADEKTEARALLPGTHLVQAQPHRYLSLLAASARVCGVTLEGVSYPLSDATLSHAYPLGISNEFVSPKASITLRTGALFCLVCEKEL